MTLYMFKAVIASRLETLLKLQPIMCIQVT